MEINNLERFLEKARTAGPALGACITFSDPAVTEVACASGLDFVWIDGEHGEMDRNTAFLHLMAVKGTGVAAFYRVPACDHTEIKRIIDFAPAGVIVPMVMDEADAAKAVAACRYPVHGGSRGCGYRRGWAYGAADTDAYLEASARDPLVVIQLEHIDAARRLDRILEVPGVDSVMVGPYDFSMSMNKPGQFHDPEVAAALDEACAKVKAKGLLLGAYAEGDFEDWRRRVVDYLGVRNDTNAMMDGFRRAIDSARGGWRR